MIIIILKNCESRSMQRDYQFFFILKTRLPNFETQLPDPARGLTSPLSQFWIKTITDHKHSTQTY
ncbi:MAG TPA: hypothetical protein DCF33_06945 [Saprospirales bacterium]|nr:hypothetical protein [Saprospirales bacterium]